MKVCVYVCACCVFILKQMEWTRLHRCRQVFICLFIPGLWNCVQSQSRPRGSCVLSQSRSRESGAPSQSRSRVVASIGFRLRELGVSSVWMVSD